MRRCILKRKKAKRGRSMSAERLNSVESHRGKEKLSKWIYPTYVSNFNVELNNIWLYIYIWAIWAKKGVGPHAFKIIHVCFCSQQFIGKIGRTKYKNIDLDFYFRQIMPTWTWVILSLSSLSFHLYFSSVGKFYFLKILKDW